MPYSVDRVVLHSSILYSPSARRLRRMSNINVLRVPRQARCEECDDRTATRANVSSGPRSKLTTATAVSRVDTAARKGLTEYTSPEPSRPPHARAFPG